MIASSHPCLRAVAGLILLAACQVSPDQQDSTSVAEFDSRYEVLLNGETVATFSVPELSGA